jgi:hypothetical protein
MNMDKLKITILQDGTIRVETDEVGQANHLSADKFLQAMARMAGGETTTERKGKGHVHQHGGIYHEH